VEKQEWGAIYGKFSQKVRLMAFGSIWICHYPRIYALAHPAEVLPLSCCPAKKGHLEIPENPQRVGCG
jgi:hypothetical protein